MKTKIFFASSKREKNCSIKSTNGNQEVKNIQKQFSQGQVKIFLIFSKDERYELELQSFYEPQNYRRYSTTLLVRDVFWKL